MGFFLSWASGKDDDGLLGGDTEKNTERVCNGILMRKIIFIQEHPQESTTISESLYSL
jgi:hypothetical protein